MSDQNRILVWWSRSCQWTSKRRFFWPNQKNCHCWTHYSCNCPIL